MSKVSNYRKFQENDIKVPFVEQDMDYYVKKENYKCYFSHFYKNQDVEELKCYIKDSIQLLKI